MGWCKTRLSTPLSISPSPLSLVISLNINPLPCSANGNSKSCWPALFCSLQHMCICVFVSTYVCACICFVVLRVLMCESVSKLFLNCSGEGLGGYMPCRDNGWNISPHVEWIKCLHSSKKKQKKTQEQRKQHMYHSPQNQTTHPPLIVFPFLPVLYLHSSSPLPHSLLWKKRTWFLPLTLLTSPTPHPFFFFFSQICLPTQSGLILLVTVDIWGPAHSVWLSSRETFPRETLWIQLHTWAHVPAGKHAFIQKMNICTVWMYSLFLLWMSSK